MNEYEIFDPGAVSIEPLKTIIKKGFSTQPSVFGWNSFSFQPINSNISIDAMEENTAHELLKLIGLETDYNSAIADRTMSKNFLFNQFETAVSIAQKQQAQHRHTVLVGGKF